MSFRSTAVAPYDAVSYSVSQGTGTGSNYIKEIFSKKMLKDFYKSTVFSEISNTDYEGEIKAAGDKVHIRRIPTISIGNYSMGGGIDDTPSVTQNIKYEVPAEDATELIIDQAKYWAFRMDYIDEMQTDLNLVSEFSSNAAEQLRIAVDEDMLKYLAYGDADGSADFAASTYAHADNIGSTAGAISGDIDLGNDTVTTPVPREVAPTTAGKEMVNAIIDINLVLDENNIPSEGRWVVLPSSMIALLKKGELRRADITGDATGVIRSGLVGMVDRTKIYQSNSVARGVNDTATYLVPFGTNEATTFAAQITKTESLPIVESFGTYWRGLFVYGRKVLQSKALGIAALKVVPDA